MSTRCEWGRGNGWQRFYDPARGYQTIMCMSPAYYEDDFLGTATLTDGTTEWSVVDVSVIGGTTPVRVADGENGQISILSDVQGEDQDSVLYWGDEKAINVKDGCIFETRLAVSVLPTVDTVIVWGVSGDHNLDKDAITESAWFRLDFSGALDVETDDTTNNNDDVTTGITLVAGTFYNFRIDTTVIADVRFYVDGVAVATGTTFDMSNLSDAEGIMQPYFSIDKTGPAIGLGTVLIDRVAAWWNRA